MRLHGAQGLPAGNLYQQTRVTQATGQHAFGVGGKVECYALHGRGQEGGGGWRSRNRAQL
eukprot:353632-Chlamydomonas_euryale.AAC.4